jgi:ppGpp synthetase/RelA/SpoT-type nucleotidyltranferase
MIDTNSPDLRSVYRDRVAVLRQVSGDIQALLEELFRGVPRVDRVSTRVKDADRFVAKATKRDSAGELKYQHPLDEIQDQIGARVVVYYNSDVESARTRLLKELRPVEDLKREQAAPDSFGYEAWHLVFFVPLDILQKRRPPVQFFELQIATLFQHAWAEAEHDLGYKPDEALTREERRKVALAAAQAWGADQIFDALWQARSGSS